MQQAILTIPEQAWTPAYNTNGEQRRGAWVAEITGQLNLTHWPDRSRVIVRRERSHPGAQLTFSDIDGHRLTTFLTDTHPAHHAAHADLEMRHRCHARVEDCIRSAKTPASATCPATGSPPTPAG